MNEFRFLVDEELNYLKTWLGKYLQTKNDTVEVFRGVDDMYEKLKEGRGNQEEDEEYDVTFLFVKKDDIKKVNKRLIP